MSRQQSPRYDITSWTDRLSCATAYLKHDKFRAMACLTSMDYWLDCCWHSQNLNIATTELVPVVDGSIITVPCRLHVMHDFML